MDTLEAVYDKALKRVEQMPNWSDVATWADQKLNVQLWSVQSAIAASVIDHTRTAVWSCHDSGKSFLAAVLSCHHIDTHPAREARVITTAPSGHQVRGVLWVEINGLWDKAKELGNPLPGRVNQTEWWIGSYQAGVGRKPNEYSADQFAGFHARYPLIILDEADGLPTSMWEGVEALMTNRKARMFCIGNPLDPASEFAGIRKRWQEGDDTYHGVVIPYSATPNFSGEPVSELVRDNLLSQEWVETKRRTWGDSQRALADPAYQPLDNPFWYGRILAEYPPEDSSTIITGWMVTRCQDEAAPPPERTHSSFCQLGIDVAASEGGDWTTVRERVDGYALREWKIRTADDDKLEEFLVECALEAEPDMIVIDAGGVGFGFTGRLRRRLPSKTRIVPVKFGAKSTVLNEDKKTKKFENLRAELYWETGRESMRQGQWNLSFMENAEETLADLTAARLDSAALAARKVIKVEEKDDIKRRLGRSPDSGEAMLLAFHRSHGGGPGSMHSPAGRQLPHGAAAAAGSAGGGGASRAGGLSNPAARGRSTSAVSVAGRRR